MSPRHALPLATLLAALLTTLPTRDARAAWPHDPVNGNVPVSTATGDQRFPSILADGQGGAFIAWHDSRNGVSNFDIFIQRVGANGATLWTANGVSVCGAANDQANTAMVADGAGGVIVAWHDARGATGWDVYVQRFNAAGVPQWTANGVALCTAAANQTNPKLVSDGAGGAIVAWTDTRNGAPDIFARRVNASGTPQWTANGVAVSTALNTQQDPYLVSDGAGGAYVVWEDSRSGTFEVFAQRYDAAGTGIWTTGGIGLTGSATNEQYGPRIASDGAGGAIVAWRDSRVSDEDIYAQRIGPTGAALWTDGGVPVSVVSGPSALSSIAADGSGGVVVAWIFSGGGFDEVYAQRVNGAGTRQWGVDGRLVCDSSTGDERDEPQIVHTGGGASIVAWYDSRNGLDDVYAQGLSPEGFPQWTTNGIAVSTALGVQEIPLIVANGAGGAIVTWHDTRNGNQDVYAQRIERYGQLGNPEPTVTAVRDVPNDQGGRVKVEWSPSYLDVFPSVTVQNYSVWRRVPNAAVANATSGGGRFRRMAPVLSAQAVDWEYLATTPARGFAAYSYVAPTTSDSLPGSNPRTHFMILAEMAFGTPYWASAPDSGYSVDNLAPATPAPFTGAYASGSTTLDWGPNHEADFDVYHLHRGTTSDFVPTAGNLIAVTQGTSWVDAPGAPRFYKIAAVDVHGNRSAYASFTPFSTVDAPGLDAPLSLRLGIPQPNPASASTGIELDLPRAAPVSLVIHDAGGRAVRTMLRGEREAGRHRLEWDLRDDAGARVASGVYFVRLETAGQRLSRRIVAMR